MKKSILTYGVIAGLIVSSLMLITFSGSGVNLEYGHLIGYSTMILAFATIFVAIKTQRDKHLGGKINFSKAFKIGLGISLIASLCYVITWMIMSETVAKDFMAQYYQHAIENLNNSSLTPGEIEEKIAQMDKMQEMYKNPVYKIGITFLEIFPVGLLVSLIAAFILKRK